MKQSQSEVALGTQNSWANLKEAERLRVRSNTAQNLRFYVEEQKRLYNELPFLALSGMRSQSFQRERSESHLRPKSSWGSFTNLLQKGEEKPLMGADGENYFEEPGYTRPLFFSCCVALLSSFQFGYNTGVTGVLIKDLLFSGVSDLQWSLMVSAFAFGGPFGAMFAGGFANRVGRKKALLTVSALFTVAGAIMCFSVNIYMLTVGRLVVGIAAGAVSVVVPLYLGELAPPNLRGALGTGYQFGMVIGILFADVMGFPFASKSTGFSQPGWRMLFGLTAFPALLQMVLAAFLEESPRWLLSKNRPKQAADILRRLRGTNDVYEEIDSICAASDNESSDMTVMDVLRDRSIRYALIVGVFLQLSQQLSGINAVMYYANSFFSRAGVHNPLVGTILVGAINVISTGVALVLMDRAGRRPLLLWSSLGMFVSGVVLTLALNGLLPNPTQITVVMLMAFVWFFEIGLGPIPWLIVAETFPSKPRSTAMSIATAVNWICNFFIGLGFPTMQEKLGDFVFVPFCAVLLITFVFTALWVPETKGKTLEEIQEELQG